MCKFVLSVVLALGVYLQLCWAGDRAALADKDEVKITFPTVNGKAPSNALAVQANLKLNAATKINCEVLDDKGKVVFSQTKSVFGFDTSITFLVWQTAPNLPAGRYVATVWGDNGGLDIVGFDIVVPPAVVQGMRRPTQCHRIRAGSVAQFPK